MKDKPTSLQLVECLGDRQDITICSDVVYGLHYEYLELENKNRLLNEMNTKNYNNYCELLKGKQELKEWLEECIRDLKQDDIHERTTFERGEILALESTLAKIEEIENIVINLNKSAESGKNIQ